MKKEELSRREFLRNMGMLGLGCVGAPLLTKFGTASAAPFFADSLIQARTQANWIPNVQYWGFYAAEKKGFYEMEGLNGNFLAGGPGIVSMRVLDGKQCEFALNGSGDSFINACAEGSRIVCIGTSFQRSPAGLIYLNSNPIKTPKDAIGKRIGLQEGATQAWYVVCAKNGIDVNDMDIVTVSYDPTVVADGTVDGYWGYMTSQPGTLRLAGYDVGFLDPWEWGNKTYGNFVMCRKDFVEEERDTCVKWLRATIRGHVYAMNHVDEMVEYTLKTYGGSSGLDPQQQKDEAKDQLPFFVSDLTDEKGMMWVDKSVWQAMIDTQVEFGELEAEAAPKAENICTYDILEEVYKDGIDSVYGPALEA